MRLHDLSADRQPKPQPGWLRRNERLEQPCSDFRGDPRTGVADSDFHRPISRPRRDHQLALFARFHRLHRIAHQVDDDLADLDPVE
jgi:hypothetical protein